MTDCRKCQYYKIEDIGTKEQPVLRMSCNKECMQEYGMEAEECPMYNKKEVVLKHIFEVDKE